MIDKNKTRVTVSILKDQDEELDRYCKKNNMTKSAAMALALSTLFYAGYKAGDLIGQMIIDKTTYTHDKPTYTYDEDGNPLDV